MEHKNLIPANKCSNNNVYTKRPAGYWDDLESIDSIYGKTCDTNIFTKKRPQSALTHKNICVNNIIRPSSAIVKYNEIHQKAEKNVETISNISFNEDKVISNFSAETL